jgi:putative ABC transport system permease protein
MGNFWKNLRYGLRALGRSPGFTAVAVATLALGIGTNAAVFSINDAVLFRPYPYRDPGRLAVIRLVSARFGSEDDAPMSYPDFAAYRERSRSFDGLAAISYNSMNVGQSESAVRVRGVRVTANLFSVVGTRVVMGRTFLPQEDRPGGERVVLLSELFWRLHLGAEPRIVGQAILIDGEPRIVIGVVDSASQLPAPNDAAVFLPLALDPDREPWDHFSFFVLGRLKPGVSLEVASAEVAQISWQIATEHPVERKGLAAKAISLRESRTGKDRPLLMLGLACAAFVLLIACSNVANLLLQRGVSRNRDLAVRTALGASRTQIVSQLLIESCLLALCGALAGLVVSHWLLRLTVRLIPPESLPPFLNNFAMDGRTLLYLLGLAVFTVLLFGLMPALKASRPKLRESLSDGGQGSGSGAKKQRLRSTLVVVEVALSMILLVVCGLLVSSFFKMINVDTGVDRHRTLLVELPLPDSKYPQVFQRSAFYEKILERVRALPGIGGAALADNMPFGGWGSTRVELAGLSADALKDLPPLGMQTASEGYFATLRQHQMAGREFTREDTYPTAQPVAVLNARAAKKLFVGRDPVGEKIKLLGVGDGGTWVTVVGVVQNIRRRNLADNSSLDVYIPCGRFGWPDMTLLVHVEGDPSAAVSALRRVVQAEDPALTVAGARTLDRVITDSFALQRVASILCGVFALFALAMSVIGMYGSLNYTVQQRTHEIGIRMALGAEQRQVITLVVQQILKLIAIGLLVGLLGSLAMSKVMAGMLLGLGAGDLLTILSVALILTVVGLLSSWIPARRASQVPPVITLRAS